MELGIFNVPKAPQDTGLDVWKTFNEELVQSASDCAAGVIADIRGRRFWPPGPVPPSYDEFAPLFHGSPYEAFDRSGWIGDGNTQPP